MPSYGEEHSTPDRPTKRAVALFKILEPLNEARNQLLRKRVSAESWPHHDRYISMLDEFNKELGRQPWQENVLDAWSPDYDPECDGDPVEYAQDHALFKKLEALAFPGRHEPDPDDRPAA